MDRFKWDNHTCEQIDWKIFGWAYKARIKKNFGWTNKYHLKQLPTGKRMQKRGGFDDERCCSCGALLETDDHLFQCPKRPQFQREILALIEETKPKLAPHLFHILYTGVKEYICKYKTDPDDEEPIIQHTPQFERVQSKFRIMEDEAVTSRKRKRPIESIVTENTIEPLFHVKRSLDGIIY